MRFVNSRGGVVDGIFRPDFLFFPLEILGGPISRVPWGGPEILGGPISGSHGGVP